MRFLFVLLILVLILVVPNAYSQACITQGHPVCGQFGCESGEDCNNCPTDCGPCPASCGGCGSCADSRYRWCTGGQYGSGQCIQDCSACNCGPTGPTCGTNGCEAGEDCNNCPQDCGVCSPTCVPNHGQACNCNACGCGGTIQCDGSCSGAAPVCGSNPFGWHDSSDCTTGAGGWTCDADNYNQPLAVHIYKDNVFYDAVTANIPAEPGVAAACGGNPNHRFSYPTPASWKDGATHTITTYAINIGSGTGNPALTGTPKTINCPPTGCSPLQGQACGNCGTVDCAGNCINQGSCSPGQLGCSGSTILTCTSGCQWQTGEDCAAKLSTDTDGSSTAYTVAGTVTDYVSCSAGSCTSNSYPDSCSNTLLTEYGAVTTSFVSGTKQCQDYESNYCSNNRYFRQEWGCSSSPGFCNDAAVPDTPIGADADADGVDQQCGDATCDNANGVCDAAVAGKCIAKTATETNCADGLDNDCDGLTDCNDPDCFGTLTGTVKSQSTQQPISLVDVTAKLGLTNFKSTTTSQLGIYSMSINCGNTYNLITSHPDYAPSTKSNVVVNPKQTVTNDFNLVLGTSCEQDCTFAADETIHTSCDGKNGCTFYDSISKAACDNAQPGWFRDYNSSHYVVCASGTPQPKVEILASVNCASGTLIKVTRIVVYNGKPVKLVVATCG